MLASMSSSVFSTCRVLNPLAGFCFVSAFLTPRTTFYPRGLVGSSAQFRIRRVGVGETDEEATPSTKRSLRETKERHGRFAKEFGYFTLDDFQKLTRFLLFLLEEKNISTHRKHTGIRTAPLGSSPRST